MQTQRSKENRGIKENVTTTLTKGEETLGPPRPPTQVTRKFCKLEEEEYRINIVKMFVKMLTII